MEVEYLLGDHLGSTSLTTDANGAKVSEMRYKAWGEVRYSWTSNPATTPAYELTKYTFTGQYSYMDDPTTTGVTEGFGLMFYNARWYDPAIGHFSQADTLIPNPADPQSWNRYSYVQNNPIRYTDPTGHVFEEPGDLADYYCNDPKYCKDGDAKFDPYILRNKKNNNIPDQSVDDETSPNHCQNGLLNCAITLPNDLPIIEFNLWVLQFKGSGSASLAYLADPHSPFYISNGSWGTDTWDFSYSGFSFGAESLSVNFYDTVDISFLFGASVDLNPTPNVSMYFQGNATLESNNFLAEESIKAEFSVRPIEAAFLYYLRRVPVKFPGIERFPLVQP